MAATAHSKDRPYTKSGTEAAWYSGWNLTEAQRDRFRQNSLNSIAAKARALSDDFAGVRYPIPTPRLDPNDLMHPLPSNGLGALSLFSGGGGLDIGFERAGFHHLGSYDVLDHAGCVLRAARPHWRIFSGADGDVTLVDWRAYRGKVDVVHGGPPCQPFSVAGRRKGASDVRDMVPELVRAVDEIRPQAFVCENVAGLAAKKFEQYVRETILNPLSGVYSIQKFTLNAADFGVPQRRQRVFFVGFSDAECASRFAPPPPTHRPVSAQGVLPATLGARDALGLSSIGFDDVAPTIRSGLTGPRHTTSIVNSATAARLWAELQIWPNGVAASREAAAMFPAKDGHYRMSVADCMLLQGFPADWPIGAPVYKALGLVGNSVAPPMGYAVAAALGEAMR